MTTKAELSFQEEKQIEEKEEFIGAERYEQLDAHIGQGTYGQVQKARDRTDGEVVAIKKIKIEGSHVIGSEDAEDEMLRDTKTLVCAIGIHFTVLREIKIMRELQHPNIISIKHVYVEGDFINLVMPHMSSDLRKLLEKRTRLSESQVKCILLQITKGVAELHGHWFLHRDLAPANIFINSDGLCKVADFGLSRSFGSPRPSKKTPGVVTLWYRAPELLFGAPFYQDRVDIWSIGCIFAELLLAGKPLFPGQGEIDQLSRIFELVGTPDETTWPDGIPTVALDLLEKMLTLDPSKRISAEKALQHPYFSSLPLPCQPNELPLHLL